MVFRLNTRSCSLTGLALDPRVHLRPGRTKLLGTTTHMAAATAGMIQNSWRVADAIAFQGLGKWRQAGGRERVGEESRHTGERRESQGSTNIQKRQLRHKKRGKQDLKGN